MAAPTAPILIHLDSPESGAVLGRSPLIVSGWALDPDGPLVAVIVGIDRELWAGTRTGLRRPDVAAAHPGVPGAETAGWRAELDLGDWPRDTVEISVVVLRHDGTWWMEVPATVGPSPSLSGLPA
ncbi:MAG: hypothetical protein ACRDKA_09275, partial [Actinomycetota bacterium]